MWWKKRFFWSQCRLKTGQFERVCGCERYHRSILHAVQDEIGVILTIVCMHGCVCVIVWVYMHPHTHRSKAFMFASTTCSWTLVVSLTFILPHSRFHFWRDFKLCCTLCICPLSYSCHFHCALYVKWVLLWLYSEKIWFPMHTNFPEYWVPCWLQCLLPF